MQTVISLGILAFGCAIGFLLLLLTQKRKIIILDVVFLGFCLTTYEWLTNTTIRLSLPFMNIGVTDILCMYLLFEVITRKTSKLSTGIRGAWYLMLLVFVFGAIRGFASNPLDLVIEDIRRLIFHFIVPIGCLATLKFSLDDIQVQKRLRIYSTIVIVFCVICWGLDLVGIHVSRAQSDSGTTMRVLRAEQVQALALLTVWEIYNDWNSRNRKLKIRTILLIGIVILLQHRSVWVSFFVGVVYLLLLSKFSNVNFSELIASKKFLKQALVGIVIIVGVLIALRNSTLVQQLILGLQGISGGDGTTLAYREQLWAGHLSTLTVPQWIIGKPFGSGYSVQLLNYTRDLTPHSAYVQTIIRCGLIGVVTVLAFWGNCIKKARNLRMGYVEAGCIMMLVFYYSYTYHFYASAIIGLFVATMNKKSESIQNDGEA